MSTEAPESMTWEVDAMVGRDLYRVTLVNNRTGSMVNRRKDVSAANIDKVKAAILAELA